MSNSYL